jgi:hypothetical protein
VNAEYERLGALGVTFTQQPLEAGGHDRCARRHVRNLIQLAATS